MWDLNQGALGLFAKERHDLTEFDPIRDACRIARNAAVTMLGIIIAVVEYRGDWPALVEILAMRYWGHATHPCFLCKMTRHRLTTTIDQFTLHSGPAEPWDDRDHKAAVDKCKIIFLVKDHEVRSKIFAALRYLKKNLDRSLAHDLLDLCPPLRKGDRLEPTQALLDVGDFEKRTPPYEVCFWRMDPKTDRIFHESPILNIEGLGLAHAAIDFMHAWHLGPLQIFVGMCFWHLIDLISLVGAGRLDVYLDIPNARRANLLHIKNLLAAHYRWKRQTDANWVKRGGEVSPTNP